MADAEKQRTAFRLEVNEDIVITLDGIGRSMGATLVDLSEGGCRVRTRLCIPYSQLQFKWKGPKSQIKLYGEMVGIRITEQKTTEFGVRFEMPQNEKDILVQELHEIQRRMAFKTEPTEGGDSGIGRAKRKAYRAPIRFPISYKVKGGMHEQVATAADLSIGGLMLITPDAIPENTEVELDFVMPVEAVDLGGEQREVVENTPFGQRKVKKLVPVRPFEPIHCKAKVVKRIGATAEGTSYGTSFFEMPAFTTEEVARFVHAFQLTQLRKAAAAADA
ncbi:MAG TPA: PilZ domain-containing protein [Candidatus Baltobacteraceae bacterium]|jgi:c-di-GMP-binding flagellar brake protein YcgR